MYKKLFKVNVFYGQYVFVAKDKEEALELATSNEFIYGGISLDDIEEVKGYLVKGPSGEVGGHQE